MKTKVLAIAILGLGAFVAPASAQIIATSIPRAESGKPGKAGASEKKFAFHIMATPLAKWKINGFATDAGFSGDLYKINASPNSKFLIAAEAAFALSPKVTFGVGGWYNKVGHKSFDYTYEFPAFTIVGTDVIDGTVPSDLSFWEGHASFFYKEIGIQGGLVHQKGSFGTNQPSTFSLYDSQGKIVGSPLSFNNVSPDLKNIYVGFLTDVFSGDFSFTDVDAFLVYKTGSSRFSPKTSVPWTISLGAGIYHYKDANTVFSGYVTGNVSVFKGLGLDVSYWYIGNSSVARDVGAADSMSRFLIGVGYTFSK